MHIFPCCQPLFRLYFCKKMCIRDRARSAPWQMTAVTLTYRVSAQTEDAVVFTFEVNDGESVLRRWEEGWECSAFLPLFKAERGSALARCV